MDLTVPVRVRGPLKHLHVSITTKIDNEINPVSNFRLTESLYDRLIINSDPYQAHLKFPRFQRGSGLLLHITNGKFYIINRLFEDILIETVPTTNQSTTTLPQRVKQNEELQLRNNDVIRALNPISNWLLKVTFRWQNDTELKLHGTPQRSTNNTAITSTTTTTTTDHHQHVRKENKEKNMKTPNHKISPRKKTAVLHLKRKNGVNEDKRKTNIHQRKNNKKRNDENVVINEEDEEDDIFLVGFDSDDSDFESPSPNSARQNKTSPKITNSSSSPTKSSKSPKSPITPLAVKSKKQRTTKSQSQPSLPKDTSTQSPIIKHSNIISSPQPTSPPKKGKEGLKSGSDSNKESELEETEEEIEGILETTDEESDKNVNINGKRERGDVHVDTTILVTELKKTKIK